VAPTYRGQPKIPRICASHHSPTITLSVSSGYVFLHRVGASQVISTCNVEIFYSIFLLSSPPLFFSFPSFLPSFLPFLLPHSSLLRNLFPFPRDQPKFWGNDPYCPHVQTLMTKGSSVVLRLPGALVISLCRQRIVLLTAAAEPACLVAALPMDDTVCLVTRLPHQRCKRAMDTGPAAVITHDMDVVSSDDDNDNEQL